MYVKLEAGTTDRKTDGRTENCQGTVLIRTNAKLKFTHKFKLE